MKMRVMYSSSKKRMFTYADALARSQNISADKILRLSHVTESVCCSCAYPWAKIDDRVRRFATELTKERTFNVAFVFDSKTNELTQSMKDVIEYVKNAGANVIEDYYFVNGGSLLTLTGRITIDQRKNIVNWLEGIMASIK